MNLIYEITPEKKSISRDENIIKTNIETTRYNEHFDRYETYVPIFRKMNSDRSEKKTRCQKVQQAKQVKLRRQSMSKKEDKVAVSSKEEETSVAK